MSNKNVKMLRTLAGILCEPCPGQLVYKYPEIAEIQEYENFEPSSDCNCPAKPLMKIMMKRIKELSKQETGVNR